MQFYIIGYISAFSERFRPAEHDFNLCSSGRLLIISLGAPQGTELNRELSLCMTALAEEICSLG